LNPHDFKNKKIISAIKGLLPEKNILLNYYLKQEFEFALEDYFAVLGPCHAEEVAEEKLSYLTISGIQITEAEAIALDFKTSYINTIVNQDILGVQYAAVMKTFLHWSRNGQRTSYGDNFLSVYIANAADEMAGFLKNSAHNILPWVSMRLKIRLPIAKCPIMPLQYISAIYWLLATLCTAATGVLAK
jgi:glycerol-3-phosphate dehydrogenase (NAD(P)+)